MEAQERHRYKTRLPRTAEKFSKNQMKSELGDLGVEFNSDQEDEVSACCSRVTILVLCGLPSSLSFVVAKKAVCNVYQTSLNFHSSNSLPLYGSLAKQ